MCALDMLLIKATYLLTYLLTYLKDAGISVVSCVMLRKKIAREIRCVSCSG